jgi:hypothetical protein
MNGGNIVTVKPINPPADRADVNIESEYAKAGWYPDPEHDGVRLWNGRSWSPLSREVTLFEAGLGGPLILHGASSPDYSRCSVARLSKRGQEKTWPATAQ